MHGNAHALGNQLGTEDTDLRQEGRELVAAHACHHVPAPDQQSECVTDDSQERVSPGMARGVIDVLETVDVHRQHRKGQARNGAQCPVELASVLEPGERIGGCKRRKFHGGLVNRFLSASALDEAPKMPTDDRHRRQRGARGPHRGLPEDDQHADERLTATDRKRQRAMDVGGGRNRGAAALP